MLTIYLGVLPAYYEGEDIEVRYVIMKDGQIIKRDQIFKDYKKPAVAGAFGLLTLLRSMEEYRGENMVILFNDPALLELMNETSTTKNADVLRMVYMVNHALQKFTGSVEFKDLSINKSELAEWDQILTF